MTPELTTNGLFEVQQAPLKLKWVAGRTGGDRRLEPATARFPGMALVGHLNLIHPNRIQVIGSAETRYLRRLSDKQRPGIIHALSSCETTAAVIVANDEQISKELIRVNPVPSPLPAVKSNSSGSRCPALLIRIILCESCKQSSVTLTVDGLLLCLMALISSSFMISATGTARSLSSTGLSSQCGDVSSRAFMPVSLLAALQMACSRSSALISLKVPSDCSPCTSDTECSCDTARSMISMNSG